MLSTLLVLQIAASIDIRDSAARMRGFETDLYLQDQEYATLLSILYIGYILMRYLRKCIRYGIYAALEFMLGRNMLLNHIGKSSIYLPACMIVWGTISILTGRPFLLEDYILR